MMAARTSSVRRALAAALAAGLLLSCTGCIDALLGPAPAVDRSTMFDQLWQQFDLHYSFFAYKGINWDSLGAEYRPRALAAQTNGEFASEIGAMLRELKDVHVSLTPTAASTYGYVSAFDTITTYFNSPMIFKNYVPQSGSTSGGHIKYGYAVDFVGIGYVRIGSFAGSGWAGEIDEALDSMPAATSLIVDVRNNDGGNVQLAVKIAGRFTAITRRYGWVRFRNGPKHTDFTDYNEETVVKTGKSEVSRQRVRADEPAGLQQRGGFRPGDARGPAGDGCWRYDGRRIRRPDSAADGERVGL